MMNMCRHRLTDHEPIIRRDLWIIMTVSLVAKGLKIWKEDTIRIIRRSLGKHDRPVALLQTEKSVQADHEKVGDRPYKIIRIEEV